ncbi:hypothetical protein [Thalassoroseus pseudoceratinae]|uniref:hypothetical protein n=1 Tax=Thalassoroseus pseudoceratinae TaxID=2713176 RepID=UPI00142042AD|nr:hypothetical protein [Thalassoroseus pseudoceratinae]
MKPTTWLCGIWMLFVNTTGAFADLNQYRLRTIEWLVDNSDTIGVFQVDETKPPAVLHTFKGDAANIEYPLAPPKFDGYLYFSRMVEGPIRLRFIRGTSELLEEIEIGRRSPIDFPTLLDVYYGVTQYGNVVLSERVLLETLSGRLRAKTGPTIDPNPRVAHARKSGVVAHSDFPLESGGETFVLIVPFTTERRDYFIKMLKDGPAAEKIRAIRELRIFDDPLSRQAITEATRLDSVKSSSVFTQEGRVEIGREDVIREATAALKWLP